MAEQHCSKALGELALIEMGCATVDFTGATGYWEKLRYKPHPHMPEETDFAVERLARRMPPEAAEQLRAWDRKWNLTDGERVVLEARGTDNETFVRTRTGWWLVQSVDFDGGRVEQRNPPADAVPLEVSTCVDLELPREIFED